MGKTQKVPLNYVLPSVPRRVPERWQRVAGRIPKGHEGEEGRLLQTTEIGAHNKRGTSWVIFTSVLTLCLASTPWLRPWRPARRNFFPPPATDVGKHGVIILTS